MLALKRLAFHSKNVGKEVLCPSVGTSVGPLVHNAFVKSYKKYIVLALDISKITSQVSVKVLKRESISVHPFVHSTIQSFLFFLGRRLA